MTHAYSGLYIENAQQVFAHMLHYVIYDLGMEYDPYCRLFVQSGVADQFGRGNPRYVAGMSGTELADEVLRRVTGQGCTKAPAPYEDRSDAFWTGYTLAWYQWYTGQPFRQILGAVPVTELLRMYPVYHEMDILHFAEEMEIQMRDTYPQMKLRVLRYASGLSQTELSAIADVPLRQIQLFEQGQRDINKTSAFTIFKLSKALHCRMEDLIE